MTPWIRAGPPACSWPGGPWCCGWGSSSSSLLAPACQTPRCQRQLGVWIRPYLSTGAHAVEYGVLALLASLAVRTLPRGPRSLAVLAFALGVSVLDEAFQSTVPGRVAEVADLLADAAGSSLALLFLRGWQVWRGKPSTTAPDRS